MPKLPPPPPPPDLFAEDEMELGSIPLPGAAKSAASPAFPPPPPPAFEDDEIELGSLPLPGQLPPAPAMVEEASLPELPPAPAMEEEAPLPELPPAPAMEEEASLPELPPAPAMVEEAPLPELPAVPVMVEAAQQPELPPARELVVEITPAPEPVEEASLPELPPAPVMEEEAPLPELPPAPAMAEEAPLPELPPAPAMESAPLSALPPAPVFPAAAADIPSAPAKKKGVGIVVGLGAAAVVAVAAGVYLHVQLMQNQDSAAGKAEQLASLKNAIQAEEQTLQQVADTQAKIEACKQRMAELEAQYESVTKECATLEQFSYSGSISDAIASMEREKEEYKTSIARIDASMEPYLSPDRLSPEKLKQRDAYLSKLARMYLKASHKGIVPFLKCMFAEYPKHQAAGENSTTSAALMQILVKKARGRQGAQPAELVALGYSGKHVELVRAEHQDSGSTVFYKEMWHLNEDGRIDRWYETAASQGQPGLSSGMRRIVLEGND